MMFFVILLAMVMLFYYAKKSGEIIDKYEKKSKKNLNLIHLSLHLSSHRKK